MTWESETCGHLGEGHGWQRKVKNRPYVPLSHMSWKVSLWLDKARVVSFAIPRVSHCNGYESLRTSEIITIQCQTHLTNVAYLHFSELYHSSQEVYSFLLNNQSRQALSLIDTFAVSSLGLGMSLQGIGNARISSVNGYILISKLRLSNMSGGFNLLVC